MGVISLRCKFSYQYIQLLKIYIFYSSGRAYELIAQYDGGYLQMSYLTCSLCYAHYSCFGIALQDACKRNLIVLLRAPVPIE
jgi:hypothetical protein